ncbi:MAG: VWA domain-containing protein [Candidatus Aminicenantes bacterium]|jgi:VWFA-related protein
MDRFLLIIPKKAVVIALLSVSILFLYLYGYQEQEQQPLLPQERHEVKVRLILVDVIVTKDGEFVKDLSKEDFELYEDDKRVPINSFELISFDERELTIPDEISSQEQSHTPKKRLAVVFDSINSWKREMKHGSEQIVDDLVSIVHLGHEVMILQLKPSKGIEIIQPFTTNEDLIRNSVERASGSIWKLESHIEPTRTEETETEIETDAQPPTGTDPSERTEMERAFDSTYFEDMQRIDFLHRERMRFEKTVGGLLATFNLMRGFPGRKYILLVSAGIPDLSPPDMFPNIRSGIPGAEVEDAYISKIWGKMEDIRVFDPFNILDRQKFKNGEEVLREIIRFANAQNISIYSFDSSIFVKNIFTGASAEYYQQSEMDHLRFRQGDKIRKVQNLRWLSEDTGADSLRGANKLSEFQKVMDTDLNHYYQLSFYPRRDSADDAYHKIKVKVKRGGVNMRFRKGYTDYSDGEMDKMVLVTAFYNPELFKELPFKGELIPFISKSGKYKPWMNIALPVKDVIENRFVEYAPKQFHLHIWLKDRTSGEKGFGGKINIGLNLSPKFMEFIKNIDYLSYHFTGPEIEFKNKEYQSVFALFDPQTSEVGTWDTDVRFPSLDEIKDATLINCVLGDLTENPEKEKKTFVLSKKDGGLICDDSKFYPKVTNQFDRWGEASLFVQTHLPEGRKSLQPEFFSRGEDMRVYPIEGELVIDSWNKRTKVWSGLYRLDFSPCFLGDNSFFVEFSESGDGGEPFLRAELKMSIIR